MKRKNNDGFINIILLTVALIVIFIVTVLVILV